MYNLIRSLIEMWREDDAEGHKDTIEGLIGWASLLAICFVLSGVFHV